MKLQTEMHDLVSHSTRDYEAEKGHSFILSFYAGVFQRLRYLSPFIWVLFFIPNSRRQPFIDCWVMGNLLLAMIAATGVRWTHGAWLTLPVMAYAALRIFELGIMYANQVLFDEYRAMRDGRATHPPLNHRRLVLLTLHNYVEIECWFAFIYANSAKHFDIPTRFPPLEKPLSALYFSVVTITTIGYGDIHPVDEVGIVLVLLQIALGVGLTLIVIARWLSFLPRVERKDIID